MAENLNNKTLYKVFLVLLKVIPMLISFCMVLNTFLSYLYINAELLSIFGGVSFLTIVFLYIASYVFKFCNYHRMFIHYITVQWIINLIDYYIGIPLNDQNFMLLGLTIFGIFLFIILYLYVTSTKKNASSDSRRYRCR